MRPGDYLGNGIESRADALANLPSRARWFPQGWPFQRNGSPIVSSLGQTMEGFLWISQTPNEQGCRVRRSWSKEPTTRVWFGRSLVGSWDNYVGIDDISEALFCP
jgi:hypothetical protein